MNFLEFISSLAWPFVAVAILWFFRDSIKALIGRIQKVGGSNAFAEFGPSSQKEVSLASEDVDKQNKSVQEMLNKFNSEIIHIKEGIIETTLKSFEIKEDGKKVEVLKRYLAVAELRYEFERLTNIIWGSQVKLLEYLASFAPRGVAKEQLQKLFYETATQSFPHYYKQYPFEEGYLRFLKNSQLVGENNGEMFLTKYGMEFLTFLTQTGRTCLRFRDG